MASIERGEDKNALCEEFSDRPSHAGEALHEEMGAVRTEEGKGGTDAIRRICPGIVVVQPVVGSVSTS
jgi:hypothetical protein